MTARRGPLRRLLDRLRRRPPRVPRRSTVRGTAGHRRPRAASPETVRRVRHRRGRAAADGRAGSRELAAGRREARARARAHGGARARRARRAGARQRPLPHELLGHEGLRRRRLPARGRPGPRLPGGECRRRRPHSVDLGRAPLPRLRPGRSPPARPAGARPRARGAREYDAVGLELSLGTQASDRMVGEPTTFPKAWFDAFPDAADATPLLAEARAVKTEQELERMRLANEIAAAAMEHVQGVLRAGMSEAQAAAEWEGFVHGEGPAGRARSSSRSGSRSCGRARDQDLHGDLESAGRRGRADAVRDLGLRRRLLVRPHEEPRRRRAHGRVPRARAGPARRVRGRGRLLPAGREPRGARPPDPARDRGLGFPGQPSHPSRTESARGRTSRRTPTRPAAASWRGGMVLAIEPGCYKDGGGGLRVEDNFLITDDGAGEAVRLPGRGRAGMRSGVSAAWPRRLMSQLDHFDRVAWPLREPARCGRSRGSGSALRGNRGVRRDAARRARDRHRLRDRADGRCAAASYGARVVGVDPSPGMLAEARAKGLEAIEAPPRSSVRGRTLRSWRSCSSSCSTSIARRHSPRRVASSVRMGGS